MWVLASIEYFASFRVVASSATAPDCLEEGCYRNLQTVQPAIKSHATNLPQHHGMHHHHHFLTTVLNSQGMKKLHYAIIIIIIF